jgi:GNAT superfamily N-acetyltransferase
MKQERRAVFADIGRLMEIRGTVTENRLTDPTSVTPADYRDFVARGRVWVALSGNLIIGFSASDDRDGTIWALFVDPVHHRQGIGTGLLARACDDLRRDGHVTAKLSTTPGTTAERFYRRLGWAEAGIAPNGEVRFRLAL